MPRNFLLATAGHIDHGKTALVRALTGTDCDRLPEERKRGLTVDLGFAHLDWPGGRLGVVDVPGHERFVKNMLAGATGCDLALLAVSAREGVMPQTREHLDILTLLGVRGGVIALTMTDLVDDDTRQLAEWDVREAAAGTPLEDAAVIPTDAVHDVGVSAVRAELTRLAESAAVPPPGELFRMPIDRRFTVAGHGTVVTGTVTSGTVAVDDEVEWLPAGRPLRVRGVRRHGEAVESAGRGQRAALNLAGLDHHEVARGQELATPGHLTPSRVLTVSLRCLPGVTRGLKHRLPVRLHVGTGEYLGAVSLLEADRIEPGEVGLAQLFLDEPAVAAWGQPFVLRDSSAERTVGGGRVLEPAAAKARRRHADRINVIRRLDAADAAERVRAAFWLADFDGLTRMAVARNAGVELSESDALIERLQTSGGLAAAEGVLVHPDRLAAVRRQTVAALRTLHEEHPLLSRHDTERLVGRLPHVPPGLVRSAVAAAIHAGELARRGAGVALAGFKPKLSKAQRSLKERMQREYREAGFNPPRPADFAARPGGDAVEQLHNVCVAEGLLIEVNDGVYMHADHDPELRQAVIERLREHGTLTVADIRDLLGTTRKFAVPVCEYLDRIGVTRRDGDLRYPAQSSGATA